MTKLNKNERNERILLDIVEQYIQRAEPISSKQLLGIYKYDLSSATLRNIMVALTEAEYLVQPHTSAGRIPTAKAYRFYVDKIKLGSRPKPKKQTSKEESSFEKQLRNKLKSSPQEVARILSHHLAEVTHSMAFAGILGINSFYREGLRNLLDEPEFITAQNIRNLIEYADSIENRLDKLYESIEDDIRVFIGAERSYMHKEPLSLMAFTQELPNHERAVFGIVGPIRMQYSKNFELLNEIKNLFD